jgi:hypothetical protein
LDVCKDTYQNRCIVAKLESRVDMSDALERTSLELGAQKQQACSRSVFFLGKPVCDEPEVCTVAKCLGRDQKSEQKIESRLLVR